MSFSEQWDQRYRDGTHMSVWPFSDLVSLVMRHGRPAHPGFKVLELGCGAGANIPFFRQLEVEYYAVEGSAHIVQNLQRRFPELEPRIAAADFTRGIPFEASFDLVVDRGSLTHNTSRAIRRTLDNLRERLQPGARFIGVDWFSTDHREFGRGSPGQDEYTRTGYSEGPFAEVGDVHFSDRQHLLDLFRDYRVELLEKKTVRHEIPEPASISSFWNLVAVRA